ncbi:MAG: isocitrate lyase/PEP mutase family protein [Gammaproteobacteria bacterium]
MSIANPRASRLRELLAEDRIHVMPGCHDAMSARLIEATGFEVGFMSGFAVSAARIGEPDTGLISYGEMLDQGRNVCAATSLPIIGDGDTGYGNTLNVRRTVQGYAQAGFAGIMIEDQVAPKRCGHTKGKQVVERDVAIERWQAAVDARDEGTDICIMARTDAIHTHGIEEAIARAQAASAVGVDILFVEAPEDINEMRRVCQEAPGIHMANMIEGGRTPILPPDELYDMGFKISVFPLTLVNASIKAMMETLTLMKSGEDHTNKVLDFEPLKEVVGFHRYYEEEARYASTARKDQRWK